MHLGSHQWIDTKNMRPFEEGESWSMLGTIENPSTCFQGWQICC